MDEKSAQEGFIPFDIEEEYFEPQEPENAFISKPLLIPFSTLPPWIPDNRTYSSDFVEMLHQEIDDYLKFIAPSPGEHAMRKLVVKRIEAVVVSLWSNAVVQVFGSFDTKLYLPSSDIDLVILEPSLETPSCLYHLKCALASSNMYSRIEVIDKAKVPIIKMVDSFTKLNVDISVNIIGGVYAADIVKSFLRDPSCGGGVRPLMLILKQFLVQRNLNEVFLGGLGSYGLLIMISAFLKMHPLIQSNKINAIDNLGILLMEFFEFYGRSFNYDDLGISVDSKGASYYLKPKGGTGRNRVSGFLSLKDPQDNSNDVGKGSYSFHQVKSEFFKAHVLLNAMAGKSYEDITIGKRKSECVSILGFLINMKKDVLDQREDLEILNEEVEEGLHPNVVPILKNHKRSREKETIYVAASSEESENFSDSFETRLKKRSRK